MKNSRRNILSLVLALFMMLMSFTSVNVYASSNASAASSASQTVNAGFDFDTEVLRGTEVSFYGWGGSEKTNAWIDGYLAETMMNKYGIKVRRVGMGIDEILSQLVSEKEAGSKKGTIDVIWINGENFYTAKKNGLLFGEFASRVPNYSRLLDAGNPENNTDFSVPVEGMEVPYGRAQMVMILDGVTLRNPIKSAQDLLNAAKENPGRMTYPAPPDFTGSAFVRNILCDVVGYETILAAGNDEAKLREVLKPGFDFLKELKPYLWKEGKTYPSDSTALNNMFADGEAAMTVSYNPYSVLSDKASGHFPATSFVSLFDKGTVGNTHFVSMAFNAPNPDAGILLINEIITAEAQAKKYDPMVWGDLPVVDNSKLNETEKALFADVKLGDGALTQEELLSKRIPELPAEVLLIIEKIWTEEIPQK